MSRARLERLRGRASAPPARIHLGRLAGLRHHHPMKTVFHDRHDARDYRKACEIARRIVENPRLIDEARAFVEEVMGRDPHQHRYAALWRALLAQPAEEIAQALTEDSERGQLLRETRPIFGRGLTSREITALWKAG